jgi:hypothetical protein
MDAARQEPAGWPAAPMPDIPSSDQVLRLGGIELRTKSSRRTEVKRRHARRWLRRIKHLLVMSLGVSFLAGIAFASLLLITPPVGSANARAAALDQAHHGAFITGPLPSRAAAALVAAGDRSLNSEAGVDPATVTALLLGGNSSEGGRGWFYLQVARDLYGGGQPGPLAGFEQPLIAIKLDLRYSPIRILGLYASIADFGHGYFGLDAASCGYFARPPAALSWGQAAMLAAVVQAPTTSDPFLHMARARAGEHAVLSMLLAAGQLTSSQAARAYRRSVHLSRAQPSRNEASRCLTHH